MNEKEPKARNYTPWIISIVSLVVVLTVGGLIVGHVKAQQDTAAQEYNKTHFNKNIKIMDVNVGDLTINQAYQKVNKTGKNQVTLENGKIVYGQVGKEKVSKSEIQNYFDKQYTKMPDSTKHSYGSQELDEAAKKLTDLSKRSVTYQLAGKDYNFAAKDVLNKVTYKDGKYVYLDVSNLTKQIKTIASKVNTLRTSYPFKTPTGKTIKIENKSYGWAINTPQAVKAIENGFSQGAKTVNGKDSIFGDGFTDEGTGYGVTANHGLGKDYIVVSLAAQKVWIYKNNKPVVTINDVVTGTVTTSKGNSDATPTGVWYIGYKQTPSVLRGSNDDGSSYASKVSYWMPFTVDGCGFHDASWRTDWSKTAYLKGGSHGCVNIRPTEIKSVWDNVSTHEPVIVY